MFKYLLYKFGQFCVHSLPLKVAYRIAVAVSDMQYYFSPRDRKAVTNNLRIILGTDGDISRQVREVFRNFGRYLLEFFRMAKFLTPEYIKTNVRIKNIEHLKRVFEYGKGGVLLTAHIGNWELGGVVISMLGYPVVAIALPHKERPVNDLFNHQREARGIKIVQTNGSMRKCIEALSENKIVAILADRDFGFRGEALDFLGRKASIPEGPAIICQKVGAPLIPAFLTRLEDDQFELVFEEPVFPPSEGSETEKIRALMTQYTSIIERQIRQHPTQWLMFREFWIK